MIEELFIAGNATVLIGTILLMYKAIKNYRILHSYSGVGSFLTFVGCLLLTLGFGFTNQFLSVGFSIPTVIFWGIVTVFKVKYK